ncbi:MAG: efflux RND transporter periplasmic adaptor subunit [Pseudoflavonifractor sp.]|nr:efflux RND transporter periplasmic adaptor subunit [Pseudoflavonifractor sp.]
MFQLSNYVKVVLGSAVLAGLSSCGHSNPEIHGGNTDPVRVKVMSMASSPSAVADSYSGTVEAGTSTTLSFSVAGTINRINVTEGQRVAKGQLIASVDGASLKNAYDIAQATLREAQDAYSRMKKLHDANALPEMQWVSVQEKLKQAEAAAAIAKTGMNDANIYAPISGVVAHKLADAGQTVAPGIPIVEIMDLGTLKVKISVPEADLAGMKTGTKASVSAGDSGSHKYNATLVEKGVAANALSRNYDVRFRVTDPDDYLLPGMICSVAVDGVKPTSDAAPVSEMVLPPQAVVLDWDNNSYVWIKKDGVAQRKRIETGGLDSRGIIVTGGINPSDSVIVEGQQKLSSGLKVVSVN